MFQVNLKRYWGIRTGLALGMDWTDMSFSISDRYIGYGSVHDHRLIEAQQYISLPVYATYKIPVHDKLNAWMLQLEAGVDVKYVGPLRHSGYDATQIDNGGNAHPLFSLDVSAARGVHPDFHLSAGMLYILPDKKLLEFSLVTRLAPFYHQSVSYTFAAGTPQEVAGHFSTTYYYMGVQVNYIFTRVRHMKAARPGYRIKPIKEL